MRCFALLLALGAAAPCFAQPANSEDSFVFKTEARLVEVYATVTDRGGRYLDGLSPEHFRVLENGEPQKVVAFEANTRELSCAILVDTTGSMAAALPTVKNAVTRLIDQFRENDWISVYGFTNTLTQFQDFTQDKAAAKRAVLRTRAVGATALFDAITEVAKDISRRNGKKAIVVFTDGLDNASYLNMDAAGARVRKVGVPVYAVAQGEALKDGRKLLAQLKELAEATGGMAHPARKPSEVERIFDEFSRGLQHTYMLAYKPPAIPDRKWRTIQVAVSSPPRATVRAKEGYFPD